MSYASEATDVAVIGGGPAGLTAAWRLREAGVRRVVVIEREREAGGIPRHADHQGYGLRDLHRFLPGPRYAHILAARAAGVGAEIRTSTQVTEWSADGGLELTGPGGRSRLQASAVLHATGCRERPRAARLVPGSRPAGVLTTGMLQQLVYLEGRRLKGRAVIVGAEHVAFSALQTLRHGGAAPVAMTTELPSHQSFLPFRLGAAIIFRLPLHTRTAVTEIVGREQVEGVELTDLQTGESREIACELVVFTGDWIPDHELAVLGGIELDPGTRGPRVDAAMRTNRRGHFAAGNLLHGAETADVAALSGHSAAAGILGFLESGKWPDLSVDVVVEPPLDWVVPSRVSGPIRIGAQTALPPGRLSLRAASEFRTVTLEISQADKTLARQRALRVGPGRSTRIDGDWVSSVDFAAGSVRIAMASARRR
jgi:thioredoxin reductase